MLFLSTFNTLGIFYEMSTSLDWFCSVYIQLATTTSFTLLGSLDSQEGRTALILAAGWDYANCVRLLLDAGADKEATAYVRVMVL